MADTLQQLLASPDRYFHSFEGDDGIFVPMDRAAYVRSIFLDRRISPAAEGGWRIAVDELAEAAPPAQSMRWIFHVAHCGSTLLARALEALTGELVLKEPLALRQVALAPDPERIRLTLALLSRRYPGQGPVLAKANVPVNFILDQLSVAQPEAAAIFLHTGLDDYLLAILRSPNHRAWLRNVTGLLAAHLGDLSLLEDAERGAALWFAMRRRFAAALAGMPNRRTLEAEHFFTDPAATLTAAMVLFGMPADPERITTVTAGPLFASYSKNPAVAFDNSARLARREALLQEIGGELRIAHAWIERSAPDAGEVEAQLAAARL
jgi:hypothetical protein